MYPIPPYTAPKGSIIDSHGHFNDAKFDGFRDELLSSMPKMGVKAIINSGCDFESIEDSLNLSRKYDFIYTSVAIHPQNVDTDNIDIARLDAIIKAEPKVVAVGETGLDYYWHSDNKEQQQKAFREHLELARENDLPVVIHNRDAHADTVRILKEHKPKGVIHCFSGSVEIAREILKIGMYISIGGVLTFKNAVRLVEVAKEVPLERILLETDAPYLAPEPFRGKINHSGLIIEVAKKLAELKDVSVEEVLTVTAKNSQDLFGI